MADDFQKNVVVSVTSDTAGATKDLQDLQNKLTDVSNTDVAKPFISLRLAFRQATADAQIAFQQFGQFSPQFIEATKRAAEFREEVRKYQATVSAFDPANKLEAIVGVARGATGAVMGVAGAMAFFGDQSKDSLETIRKLQGLMAFSEALGQITLLRNSFTAFTTVVQSSAAYQAISNGLTKAATVIQQAFGVAVDETAISFKVLKGAIAATGIGLLIVAIGELVAHWDEVKEAMGGATVAEKALAATNEDMQKGLTSAIETTTKMADVFDLAKKGVISKKDALLDYNLTLGDAMGKTNDFATAEKNFNSKKDEYIQAMKDKALANVAFTLSAKASADEILAATKDQTSFYDKAKAGAISFFQGSAAGIESLATSQISGIQEFKKGQEELKKQFDQIGNTALSNSLTSGANADPLGIQKAKDEAAKKAEEAEKRRLEKAAEAAKKAREAQQKLNDKALQQEQDLIHDNEQIGLSARDKELADLLRTEQDKAEIATAGGRDVTAIYEDWAIKRQAINDKYDAEEIKAQAKTADEIYNLTKKAFDRQDKLASEDAASNVKKVTAENKTDARDSLPVALQKIKNISDAISKQTEIDRKKEINASDKHAETLYDINKKWDDKTDEDDANRREEEKKAFSDHYDYKVNVIKTYGDITTGIGEAADAIAGKQTVLGKELAVAGAIINTYSAIVAALKHEAGIKPTALAIAEAIAIGIFGFAQVVKMQNTKIPGNTSSTGSAPTVTAPQLSQTLLPASIANQIQNVRVVNQDQQPIRAYITQTDLTNNQQKQDLFNRLGSI